MHQRPAGIVLALFILASCSTGNAKNPSVEFQTTLGNFTLELYADKAPKTVANILSYVDSGFYEGVIFHRVIGSFMAQGGGFTADLQKKPVNAPVQNEADNGLLNTPGTVAMARTSNPNSATSQFFINLADNTFLNHTSKDARGWGYCVFGKVTAGMDVVERFKTLPTKCPSKPRGPCNEPLPPGMRDVPVEPVVIRKATRK